jgi:UDP-N-acetyl-D-galactosamine dehydrogenase
VASHTNYIDGGWQLIRQLLHDGAGLVLDVKAKLDRSSRPAGIERGGSEN